MGVVYKAEDTKLRRPVALKFLSVELTQNQQAKERFVQEARAASALDHPNICTIHSIDETDDGQMFICMAYCDGHTLKPPDPSNLPDIATVVDLAIQVGKGLAKAHEHGIVHRDVKPANLIITKDRLVKIVDFGLAKLGGATRITKTGTTMGTPAYMSPEQVRGVDVDHRTDIWSLGVILYEQLSGELPFKGEYEMSILYSIVNEQPVPLSELRPDLPPELAEIVMKALRKDPAERFSSMTELVEALTAFQAGQATRPALRAQKAADQPTRTVVAPPEKASVPSASDATVAVEARQREGKAGRAASKWFFLLLAVAVLAALGVLLFPRLDAFFTARTGYVWVESEPEGAEIVLDGSSTGLTTPALLSQVAPGNHQIALRLAGHREWRREFALTGGDTTALQGRLAPLVANVSSDTARGSEAAQSGSDTEPVPSRPVGDTQPVPEKPEPVTGALEVRSEPAGAAIFLNGENTRQHTPFAFSDLKPGEYAVRLTYPGYLSSTRTVTVSPGQTVSLRLTLQPEPPGTLKVPAVMVDGQMVFPEIFVNGVSQGQPPLTLTLSPGTYEVTAKLLGYVTENPNQQVRLQSGQETRVTFRFRKAGER